MLRGRDIGSGSESSNVFEPVVDKYDRAVLGDEIISAQIEFGGYDVHAFVRVTVRAHSGRSDGDIQWGRPGAAPDEIDFRILYDDRKPEIVIVLNEYLHCGVRDGISSVPFSIPTSAVVPFFRLGELLSRVDADERIVYGDAGSVVGASVFKAPIARLGVFKLRIEEIVPRNVVPHEVHVRERNVSRIRPVEVEGDIGYLEMPAHSDYLDGVVIPRSSEIKGDGVSVFSKKRTTPFDLDSVIFSLRRGIVGARVFRVGIKKRDTVFDSALEREIRGFRIVERSRLSVVAGQAIYGRAYVHGVRSCESLVGHEQGGRGCREGEQ